MRLRKLAVLLLFAGNSVVACRVSAQKPLRMTIDELFRRVEQSNVEVKAAQKDVNISRQLEKNARAKRLPDIGLEAGVNYLGMQQFWNVTFRTLHVRQCPIWATCFLFRSISLSTPEVR